MYPNSSDLEDFIKQGNWKEKLSKKPLIGFDVSIAADFLLGKHQDMKFANYIIIEEKNAFVVACIDHEKWDGSLMYAMEFIDEINVDYFLKRVIVDLNTMGQENKIGLYNDPQALDFIEFVVKNENFLKIENIENFYKKVSTLYPRGIIELLKSIDGSEGLITRKEFDKYMHKLFHIRHAAEDYIYNYDHAEKNIGEEVENNTPKIGRR